MSICKYCGKSAGFLSSSHKECEDLHTKGLAEANRLMDDYFKYVECRGAFVSLLSALKTTNFITNDDIALLASNHIEQYVNGIHHNICQSQVSTSVDFFNATGVSRSLLNKYGAIDKLAQKFLRGIMVDYFTKIIDLDTACKRASVVLKHMPLSQDKEQDAYLFVLNKAAEFFLKDGVLTNAEQKMINDYAARLSLPIDNLPTEYRGKGIERINEASVLNNLKNGIFPSYNSALPIILTKNEHLLWAYRDVTCYVEKVRRETVGRTGGFSFRICKGVTYRIGQFKGHPIEHNYMDSAGTGALFITSKNLVFYASDGSIKIPYSKIIGINPGSDGIEIHRDGNAKRVVFSGFDSWFIMNLLSLVGTL